MTTSVHADSTEYWHGNSINGTRKFAQALASYHYERASCEQTKQVWARLAGKKTVKPRGRPKADRTIRPKFIQIIERAAAYEGVSVEELNDRKNNRRFRIIRQAAALAVHWECMGASYLMIASLLNRTDHSTIMHAVNEAKKRCIADPEFAALVEALRD